MSLVCPSPPSQPAASHRLSQSLQSPLTYIANEHAIDTLGKSCSCRSSTDSTHYTSVAARMLRAHQPRKYDSAPKKWTWAILHTQGRPRPRPEPSGTNILKLRRDEAFALFPGHYARRIYLRAEVLEIAANRAGLAQWLRGVVSRSGCADCSASVGTRLVDRARKSVRLDGAGPRNG